MLMHMNLPHFLKDRSSQQCEEIADAYFGKKNIYIYTVEKNDLKRWRMEDNRKVDNMTLFKGKHVSFFSFTIISMIFSRLQVSM